MLEPRKRSLLCPQAEVNPTHSSSRPLWKRRQKPHTWGDSPLLSRDDLPFCPRRVGGSEQALSSGGNIITVFEKICFNSRPITKSKSAIFHLGEVLRIFKPPEPISPSYWHYSSSTLSILLDLNAWWMLSKQIASPCITLAAAFLISSLLWAQLISLNVINLEILIIHFEGNLLTAVWLSSCHQGILG